MSVPFGSAVLTLDEITKQIRSTFEQFTDPCRGKNTRYTLVDAGLSAFYQLLHRKLPSRQRLFGDIRTLTSYLCFENWEALMTFMLQSFEPAPPQPETG